MSTKSSLQSVRSKAETLTWFLARPPMHRELVRRIASLGTARSQEQDLAKLQARQWCESALVDISQACVAANVPVGVSSLSSLYPDIWASAQERASEQAAEMGGQAHIDFLHHICLHRSVDIVIETGVAAGWSSLAILLAMHGRESGELTSIDMPYPKRNNERSVGCVVPETLRDRWRLYRQPDRDALPKILKSHRSIDLVHHDSDKSYEGRLFVYRSVWALLSPSGILMSDDIEDNLAFRDFAQSVGRNPVVLAKGPGNFAGLIIR